MTSSSASPLPRLDDAGASGVAETSVAERGGSGDELVRGEITSPRRGLRGGTDEGRGDGGTDDGRGDGGIDDGRGDGGTDDGV